MGRSDKGLGADQNSGAQLVSLIPAEVSNVLANTESRLAVPSQQSPEADESNPNRSVSDHGEVSPFDKVARDMTLLAELVIRRRQAKSESASDQDQELPSEAQDHCERLGFQPITIAFYNGGEIETVASVMQAIEYLTTKWPARYGDAFEEALQACIDSIKGKGSPEHVRSALVNAAEAAGMCVNPRAVGASSFMSPDRPQKGCPATGRGCRRGGPTGT